MLIVALEFLEELSHKLIHFINLIHIVFPLPLVLFGGGVGDCDRRIF